MSGELMAKASKYCRSKAIKPILESKLGQGQDELAIARLEGYGIFYLDVRPGNVNCNKLRPWKD